MGADESEIRALISAINKKRNEVGKEFGLVIIDTLARNMEGDENSNSDMNDFVRACDELKARTGATVLVVHHTGKDSSKNARGASALRGACDYEYLVEKAQSLDQELVVRCKKMKDGKDDHGGQFALSECHLFDDSDGDPVNSLVCGDASTALTINLDDAEITLTPKELALWEFTRTRMENCKPSTKALIKDDLAAVFGKANTRSNFNRWLNGAIGKGAIEIEGDELRLTDLSPANIEPPSASS